jgi:hypothetical protein
VKVRKRSRTLQQHIRKPGQLPEGARLGLLHDAPASFPGPLGHDTE